MDLKEIKINRAIWEPLLEKKRRRDYFQDCYRFNTCPSCGNKLTTMIVDFIYIKECDYCDIKIRSKKVHTIDPFFSYHCG